MARNQGLLSLSANFEPKIAEPFDSRMVVEEKSDLILLATWDSGDGNAYVYKGMLVSVINDSDSSNNGVYRLIDSDYTQIENWKILISSTDEISHNSLSDIQGGAEVNDEKQFYHLSESIYNLTLLFPDRYRRIEIEELFKYSYATAYSELSYDVNGNLVTIDIYENSDKLIKLFTKTITYDSGNISIINITDETNSNTLTKTFTYDISGNIETITKEYIN